jgi:cytochrome c oxidase subunit II
MKWLFAAAAHANSFMPPAGTDIAARVDNIYEFLLVASLISCIILIGGMIYFVVKYKRKSATDKTAYITHNSTLEFVWSFIPLVIFLVVFAWGWNIYHDMRAMPKNALEVHVVGKQWLWDFIYKSGKKSTNEAVVPVGEPVKLIMTSEDVLHSFYIPSMRIKQDVIPGRYTAIWFTAEKTGDYQVFCTEFCGAAHSNMLAKLKVVPREEYEKWIAEGDDSALPLAKRGEKLYSNNGCVACHSIDGTAKVGPTLKGKFGAMETLEDGSQVKIDENYLAESMLNPNAKVVKGYPRNVMPAFQGKLNEEELSALVEFIKTLN